MNKIITTLLIFSSLIFAQNNITLSGEFALNNGNPFKRVLEVPKKGSLSILENSKNLNLNVKTNIRTNPIYNNLRVKKSYTVLAEDLTKIVKTYLSEDFVLGEGKPISIVFNSGFVYLTYINNEENSNINHLSKIEVTLEYTLKLDNKNISNTITLDHTLGIKGDNYDWTISTEKDYFVRSLEENIQRIIETQIFKVLNENVMKG